MYLPDLRTAFDRAWRERYGELPGQTEAVMVVHFTACSREPGGTYRQIPCGVEYWESDGDEPNSY